MRVRNSDTCNERIEFSDMSVVKLTDTPVARLRRVHRNDRESVEEFADGQELSVPSPTILRVSVRKTDMSFGP